MEWFPAVQESKENQLKQAKYKFNQFLPNLAKKKKKQNKQTNQKTAKNNDALFTIQSLPVKCDIEFLLSFH